MDEMNSRYSRGEYYAPWLHQKDLGPSFMTRWLLVLTNMVPLESSVPFISIKHFIVWISVLVPFEMFWLCRNCFLPQAPCDPWVYINKSIICKLSWLFDLLGKEREGCCYSKIWLLSHMLGEMILSKKTMLLPI